MRFNLTANKKKAKIQIAPSGLQSKSWVLSMGRPLIQNPYVPVLYHILTAELRWHNGMDRLDHEAS